MPQTEQDPEPFQPIITYNEKEDELVFQLSNAPSERMEVSLFITLMLDQDTRETTGFVFTSFRITRQNLERSMRGNEMTLYDIFAEAAFESRMPDLITAFAGDIGRIIVPSTLWSSIPEYGYV